MPAERLQKIIAAAGIASRRKAEQLIAGGLVSVNGQVVTELGSKADSGARSHPRQRQAAARRAEARLSADEQAQGIRHHRERSRKAAHGDGPAARRGSAGLSRGPARLCQRRPAAADQRRRARRPADESRVARPQDLRGQSCGHSPPPTDLAKLRAGVFIPAEGRKRSKTAPARSRPFVKPTIPGTK